MQTDLWSCVIRGNPDAFLVLYESHYQPLFSYGFSLSADRELVKDGIQEMFMEIWKTRSTLNNNVGNVRSYLFTWLRRKIFRELTRINSEKNNQGLFEASLSNILPYDDLLVAFQQNEEDKCNLQSSLKNLSRGQMEVIRLKFFENLSYIQIAAKTSLSVRTVYNLIYEALGKLKKSMIHAEQAQNAER